MGDWTSGLKADPTNWLLEEENPSVRYFTLKDILGRPEDDTAVQAARRDIMQTGMVRDILDRQREPAYLETYSRYMLGQTHLSYGRSQGPQSIKRHTGRYKNR
jgi:hypothetical protein